MRQSGRYLPEYRKLKQGMNIMELLKHPDICSEITLLPVRKFGVDAAIIFADIMLPLEGSNIKFKIEEGKGPIILNPIKNTDDVDQLACLSLEENLSYLWDSIELTVEKLDDIPLIGFSAAPFTLASYLVEGQATRDFAKTKNFMFQHPEAWRTLMDKLTTIVQNYLRRQVKYGVKAIQLFDSWAGCLSKEDYETYALQYVREISNSLKGLNIPKIIFCTESYHLLETFKDSNADGVSVDWRTPIREVWQRCGDSFIAQGNLDPSLAVVGGEILRIKVLEILQSARGHRGYIFNLGHGVLKDTPPENLKEIVDLVHSTTLQKR